MGAPSQVTHNHSTAHRAQTAENREQAGAMRHLRNFRKLNRTSSHRKAMMRNQVTQLIKHDAIVTTLPKAKELRRLADQVVTLAKQNSLHSFRQANAVITEPAMVHKLFATMPQRFEGRQGKLVSWYIVDRPTKVRAGGYTRIRKLGQNRY